MFNRRQESGLEPTRSEYSNYEADSNYNYSATTNDQDLRKGAEVLKLVKHSSFFLLSRYSSEPMFTSIAPYLD